MFERSVPLRLLFVAALASAIPVFVTSCEDQVRIEARRVEDVFDQADENEVDVLWIIDNSGSMQQEQADVAANFGDFISEIQSIGIDFHVGVVTTDMTDPEQRGRLQGSPRYLTVDTEDLEASFSNIVQVGTDGSRIERGLSAALAAVRPPLSTHDNHGFLRDEAALLIIVVSDENDCSDTGVIGPDEPNRCVEEAELLVSVDTLVSDLRRVKDNPSKVILSAIVFTGEEGAVGCGGAAPGTRYVEAAHGLGGLVKGICDDNYSTIMAEMGLVASGVRHIFPLSRLAVEETIEVELREDPEDVTPEIILPSTDGTSGWSYDLEANAVTLLGASQAPRGTQVLISYETGYGGGSF